jgi:phage terminase small subunit
MAQDKKPQALLKLAGTYRYDQHSAVEFAPEPGIPDAPSCLSGEALAEWYRIAGLLHDQRLISGFDRAALTQYCILWHQLSDAPTECTAALNDQLRSACTALGFSPLTRHKVARLGTSQEQESYPWDQFAVS